MKTEFIEINQTLHGYHNGHTLLGSSIDINTEAKRVLLMMSDMSGQTMQKGFEEYITGYPLKDINSFAIAKTWYAPEMKRPGCVWTHTLLLSFSDLARINNPLNLLSLFQRPLNEDNFEKYKDPIKIDLFGEFEMGLQTSSVINYELLRHTYRLLYNKSESSVIIKHNSVKSLENLLLFIWQQQWPRLRRNFSFCSGAINLRQLQNSCLDLQIVPQALNLQNLKLDANIVWFNYDSLPFDENKEEEWLNILVEDLVNPTKLRLFFRYFGADLNNGRRAMRPLIQLYLFFKKKSNLLRLEKILSELALYFPNKIEANILKLAVLKPNEDNTTSKIFSIPSFNESEILFNLAITECYESFDFEKIDFENRFKNYYKNNRVETYDLMNRLIATDINPYGEKLLSIAALNTKEGDLFTLTGEYYNLILIFVALNPKFSYSIEFWINNPKSHKEIISTLVKSQRNHKIDWQIIIDILIEIDSRVDIDYLDSSGINVCSYVLNWFEHSKTKTLSSNWLNFLKTHPKKIISWLQSYKDLHKTTLRLILSILNPNSNEVIHSDNKIWQTLLVKYKSQSEDVTYIELAAFSLAFALNKDVKNSHELIKLSFEPVYNSIRDGKLDYSAWLFIEAHTQPLSFFKDWDKCKKLVKAVVLKFLDHNWSYDDLFEVCISSEITSRLEVEYKKAKKNY